MNDLITVAFLGDIMLGRLVDEQITVRPPESFWGDTLPVLRGCDAVIANLECAVTDHRQIWQETPKVFYFGAKPAAVDILRVANIKCVNLANNHTLDYEVEGFLDTLRHLDEAGIEHVGAGNNLAEAREPAVLDIAGIKMGFIGLTDNEPAFAASDRRPGTNYTPIDTEPHTIQPVKEQIASARSRGAEIVCLSAHLGPNMVPEPSDSFIEFAHKMADLGVDIFYGHSAHVFQGVEIYDKTLIMHDTGDFLDDYAVDYDLHNDWSFIFLIEIAGGAIGRLRLLPVRLSFAQVGLAVGDEFDRIRNRMRTLCRAFQSDVVDTEEGLEVMMRSS